MSVRTTMVFSTALVALVIAGCGSSHPPATGTRTTTTTTATNSATSTVGPTQPGGGTIGFEGIPIEQGQSLAPASTTTPGTTVDGIKCLPSEQVVYHIHVHLQVYVHGQPRQLPGGIGIIQPVEQPTPHGPVFGASQCYYFLHTHTADGIIHIESPTPRIYTLGNFFDEWRQPLTSDSVAGAHGHVTALVNGKPWTKSPRAIPLVSHEGIQLEVGRPLVPSQPISFANTGL